MFEINKLKKILDKVDGMNVLSDSSNKNTSLLEVESVRAFLEKWAKEHKKIVIMTSTTIIVLSATSLLLKNPILAVKNDATGKVNILINEEEHISSQKNLAEDNSFGSLMSGFYYVDEDHVVLGQNKEKAAILLEVGYDDVEKQFILPTDDAFFNNRYFKAEINRMFEEYLANETVKQGTVHDDEMTEEEVYIQKYSDIFGLNYEKVYQALSDITDDFTNEEYVENYIIGDSKLKKRDVVCTNKEMAFLIAIRNMYYEPERYGYLGDVSELKTGIQYQTDLDYAHQIAQISDVLGVDKALNYAICESITNFDNAIFLESHNPSGLVFNGSYAVFPSDTAGFIEQSLELLKHQIDGRGTIEEVSRQYVPSEPASTALISKVSRNYKEAEEYYNHLWAGIEEEYTEETQEKKGVQAVVFENNYLKQIVSRIVLEEEEIIQEQEGYTLNLTDTDTSSMVPLSENTMMVSLENTSNIQTDMASAGEGVSDILSEMLGSDILTGEESVVAENNSVIEDADSLEQSNLDFDDGMGSHESREDIETDNVEENLVDEIFEIYNSPAHNAMNMMYEEYLDRVEEKREQELQQYEEAAAQWVCEHYGMSASELEVFTNSFIQTSRQLETGFYDKVAVYNYLYEIAQVPNDEKEIAVMENLELTAEEYRTVVNTFIGEAAHSYSDGYGVASVGVLRTASAKWVHSHGTNIYDHVTAPGQFTVYLIGRYAAYDGERDSIRYQGILDALYSKCPSHTYGNFEASFTESQLFQFVGNGNKYGRKLTDLDVHVFQEAASNFLEISQDVVLEKTID